MESLVNMLENAAETNTEALVKANEDIQINDINIKESLVESIIRSISAKTIVSLRSVQRPCNSIDFMAVSILMIFDKDVPKSFPWEQVAAFFTNPGIVIQEIRKTIEFVKNKRYKEPVIREIHKNLLQINAQDVNSHKSFKDLQLFYNYLSQTCEYYVMLYPETLSEAEVPKKKFRIPKSNKNSEENELLVKLNKEKKELQELKYKERRMKWEEERDIKREIKQEQLREIQREINYSKSIEDEYRRKLELKKKSEKNIKSSQNKIYLIPSDIHYNKSNPEKK